MLHLGDITKIDGKKIEPVDCITFGSPCQDFSVTGLKVGLSGSRSGLFMEAIRVITEMRESTNGKYPKFAIFENTPGVFSSNNREDFRTMLEKLTSIVQPDISIPRPTPKGKWSKAGVIVGDGWSLAWRQLDSQHFGVPQRRKRVALVADFTGQSAGRILFEQTILQEYHGESNETRKGTSRATKTSAYKRCVPEVIPFDTTQITSPQNGSNPKWGDPCHSIAATAHIPTIIVKDGENFFARKLTPVECERLQGYPDDYTNIGNWIDSKNKKHKYTDGPRYKALGNSIALPQWLWIVKRVKPYIGDNATLGSLFDGIGGFPLVWETVYGKGSAKWASEIEEFCIAVTKLRFPE